jgi:hypothetical protein
MSQLWIETADVAGGWRVAALQGPAFALHAGDAVAAPIAEDRPDAFEIALLCADAAADRWFVVVRGPNHALRINGVPVSNGLRAIRDRDMLQLHAGTRLFFTTERPAEVVPFPGIENGQAYCARCRQPIELETPAVRCPNPACRVWHHQRGELECWTHADHCSLCDQPTALDGSLRWSPEEL